jgi:uncharacterized membrane protein (UPF0182 family)
MSKLNFGGFGSKVYSFGVDEDCNFYVMSLVVWKNILKKWVMSLVVCFWMSLIVW